MSGLRAGPLVLVACFVTLAVHAADKTIVVVEKSDDPNAKTNHENNRRNLPPGGEAVEAGSLDDAEAKILGKLGEGDCIKRLDFRGHAAPGVQGVGDGVGYDSDKHINTDNQNKWIDKLKDLKGRFCRGAVISLWGCNVGSCTKGAAKLQKIADEFNVTARGAVNTVTSGGQEGYRGPIQEAKPGQPTPECKKATVGKAKPKKEPSSSGEPGG